MTVVLFSFDSGENLKANVCQDKFCTCPYLSIFEVSENGFAYELYRNTYHDTNHAKKALYSYAKRYSLPPFHMTYNYYENQNNGGKRQ